MTSTISIKSNYHGSEVDILDGDIDGNICDFEMSPSKRKNNACNSRISPLVKRMKSSINIKRSVQDTELDIFDGDIVGNNIALQTSPLRERTMLAIAVQKILIWISCIAVMNM